MAIDTKEYSKKERKKGRKWGFGRKAGRYFCACWLRKGWWVQCLLVMKVSTTPSYCGQTSFEVVNVQLLPSAVQAGIYPNYRNDPGCGHVCSYSTSLQSIICCGVEQISLPVSSCDADIGINMTVHCKKRVMIFPSPAGMSLTKLSRPGRVWLMTSRLGTGTLLTFITVCFVSCRRYHAGVTARGFGFFL